MQTVASASDNLEKLANSGAAERHLAIYVDHSATSVLMAFRDFEPPAEVPGLPAEIGPSASSPTGTFIMNRVPSGPTP